MALLTTRTLLLFNAALTLAVLVNLLGCLWWNLVRFLQAVRSLFVASPCC